MSAGRSTSSHDFTFNVQPTDAGEREVARLACLTRMMQERAGYLNQFRTSDADLITSNMVMDTM